MKATAAANANIALVKYWGKRDKALILPYQSSVSMTCDGLQTITTVEFSPSYSEDQILINDEELKKDSKDVLGHLERIRTLAGIKEKAKVVSETNFPVAAGLASSASGLAAITLAAATAAGLKLSERELTILARQGSGSACRSIIGGFAIWNKGRSADGSDSYAAQIAPEAHWPEFRMIATILTEAQKQTSSRAGMAQSVETCPYYPQWVESAERDAEAMRKAILEKDFPAVAALAQHNALKMHAVMMATKPPIIYFLPQTLEVIHHVLGWQQEGMQCAVTMDGGPQVKVLCLAKDVPELARRLKAIPSVIRTVECKPGAGAQLLEKHLF